MKTTASLFVLAFLFGSTFFSNELYCQTYTSSRQYEVTPSGDEQFLNEKVTLTMSSDKNEFKVKYDDLTNSMVLLIKYYKSTDDGDYITALYLIENNAYFQGLYVYKNKTRQKFGDYSYTYKFVLFELNEDGSVRHSTMFYANRKTT